MEGRKVWIETYGCQMNKAESEALLASLAEQGWREAESEESADLVVLNTCSVRRTAEQRVTGRLGYYRKRKRERRFSLAVMGCMAERMRDGIVSNFPEVDVVVGNFRKVDFARALGSVPSEHPRGVLTGGNGYSFNPMHYRDGPKAFIPIMHGCDNFCSYCIVPMVRGREVSRDPAGILAEIRSVESRGVKEITLLGQNVNSYRYGAEGDAMTFSRLMRKISGNLASEIWLRFLTSHPRDLSEEILEAMAMDPRYCKHIHLPLQSGSEKVLKAMNRGYTPAQYTDLVKRIRSTLRGVSLTTDILIGFPGETAEDFADTVGLMESVGFEDAFMYYYNPREGTPAFGMADPVSRDVKLSRLARVIEIQKRITRDRMRDRLGSEANVLVEGVSKRSGVELLARTEWDAMAVFAGPPQIVGSFARIRLRELSGATFRATAI